MIYKIRRIYREFPATFWTLIAASFVDRLGGALLMPFFALYITSRFGVDLIGVGLLFALFAIAHGLGSIAGGLLADKVGRRLMIIVGLVASGLTSLGMGLAGSLPLFYVLSFLAGFAGSLAGPARQAMVADLLPAAKQPEGYGLLRIQLNLAVTIGPAIGGLLVAHSYLWLFVADAVTSLVTAVIVYFILPESKPVTIVSKDQPAAPHSLGGYGQVLANSPYIAFLLVSILISLVYMQLTTTLPVYLRDNHSFPAQGFGYLLSLNAAMVVLLQFWLARRVTRYAPMTMMAVGALLIGIGMGLFGFVSGAALFIVAIIIFTLGEMVMAPVGQTLVAQFAPEEMRGRYMAAFEVSETIPATIGPFLAGSLMVNYNPNWVWYLALLIGFLAMIGYLGLHLVLANKWQPTVRKSAAGTV